LKQRFVIRKLKLPTKYDVDWQVILYKTAHTTVGTKRKVHIPVTPLEITQQDRNEVMRK
jgi:hypothetical protein